MHHSLEPENHSLTCTLLSRSPGYEPYLPESKQNFHYTLGILSELGDIAQESLKESKKNATSVEVAPEQGHSPPQSPLLHSSSALKKNQRSVDDQALLAALAQLKSSCGTLRKSTGLSSAVIRPSQTSDETPQ
ncbi:MAG: hypothetical protein ACO3A2_01795 [Bdellovibrionia bacterium]